MIKLGLIGFRPDLTVEKLQPGARYEGGRFNRHPWGHTREEYNDYLDQDEPCKTRITDVLGIVKTKGGRIKFLPLDTKALDQDEKDSIRNSDRTDGNPNKAIINESGSTP